MAFINASDESKTIRITIWPPVYKRIHEIIKENGIFIFTISNEEKGMIGLDANKYI
jgi:DNA polymerase III alpha subunit